ncbi:MAG: hypothetical protein KF727_02070 [Microbacteriaceae bacterium]|nr:hypothetical protein [Microbacteriaceae bacterium]
MKIDVRTPDGQRMTWRHATLPLGSALRIAPAFTATATADDIQVESTIEAVYSADAGRYRIAATAHRATSSTGEITPTVLRQVRLGELLTAAVPHCVTVEFEGKQRTVHDLLATGGRVVPEPLAAIAVAAGPTADTLGLVQLIYGVAALAASPPMRAVANELGIPERTATHWISKARAAGLLEGIRYVVGRQPDGAR